MCGRGDRIERASADVARVVLPGCLGWLAAVHSSETLQPSQPGHEDIAGSWRHPVFLDCGQSAQHPEAVQLDRNPRFRGDRAGCLSERLLGEPAGIRAYLLRKDALAGTLAPVTREYDLALSPIRGYVSLSFAHEVAELWAEIDKPIFAFYLGDFDPSGFDLERDIWGKLRRYCRRYFEWKRLAVLPEDFDGFSLIPLEPKKSDRRYLAFVNEHGERCAELDALPANELRQRVRSAIESHVPTEEWKRLQEVERIEKQTFDQALEKIMV